MTNETLPLVSICIPTYNGEEFIAEAMSSALTQTYANLEIVISDDQSTDSTLDIVRSFMDNTEIPIQIHQHTPKGIGANWNNCVKQSNGAYIKFLFQDDIITPDCIEKMATVMLSSNDVGLVYSKRNIIYDTLTEEVKSFIDYYGNLHECWSDFKVDESILSGKIYLKDLQLLNSPKNKIGEPSNVLLNRECFETIGYFSEDLQQTLDSDYWYRVMTKFDIGFINENLSMFRVHEKQASNVNKQREIPDKALMYRRYYDYLYKYLHPKNKLKLLKLYHPFFKFLVKTKQLLHVK